MKKIYKKSWTILIYANGNNDLAPEMIQAKSLAETIGTNEDVNVVMQISLAPQNLVKTIRPKDPIIYKEQLRLGGHRYLIGKNSSKDFGSLGPINMADKETLLDFIKWGTQEFPAQHYCLLLGGHGYQFVGCGTDYSQRLPYILSYVEMCNAIEESNVSFEFIMLDTCYTNFIEIIYEFGRHQSSPVKYVITYLMNGPLTGYPLNTFIHTIQTNKESVEVILRELTYNSPSDTVTYKINHETLSEIKSCFNHLATELIMCGEYMEFGIPNFFQKKEEREKNPTVIRIVELTNELIVMNKVSPNSKYPLLNIASEGTKVQAIGKQYRRLGFAQGNNWSTLLFSGGEEDVEQRSDHNVILSPQAIFAFISIMNPCATFEDKRVIFNNLAAYKGWRFK